MYPYELEKVIKDNNYKLGGNMLLSVIDTNKNPQLVTVTFHPENSTYDMWDKYGNHYGFEATKNNNQSKRYVKTMSR